MGIIICIRCNRISNNVWEMNQHNINCHNKTGQNHYDFWYYAIMLKEGCKIE